MRRVIPSSIDTDQVKTKVEVRVNGVVITRFKLARLLSEMYVGPYS